MFSIFALSLSPDLETGLNPVLFFINHILLFLVFSLALLFLSSFNQTIPFLCLCVCVCVCVCERERENECGLEESLN